MSTVDDNGCVPPSVTLATMMNLPNPETVVFEWPQQSTWGRTSVPIEIVRFDGTYVVWRYPDARPGDVNETRIGTFEGKVRITRPLG